MLILIKLKVWANRARKLCLCLIRIRDDPNECKIKTVTDEKDFVNFTEKK